MAVLILFKLICLLSHLTFFSLLNFCSLPVVSTLFNFVRLFAQAHEENLKQIELERKKAQKEAENKKVKIGTAKKKLDLQQLLQSSLRSGNSKVSGS